jgi:hypothetical protein
MAGEDSAGEPAMARAAEAAEEEGEAALPRPR